MAPPIRMAARRPFIVGCVGACCLLLVGSPLRAESPQRAKKALLIGIDGCRFDALQAAKTPHLDALIERGGHAENCLILSNRYRENDTISGPGWSSILTGVWADKHGVKDNSFKGSNYDEYPHFFTLLKRRLPQARTASFATWGPIDEFIVRDGDARAAFKEGTAEERDAKTRDAAAKEIAHPEATCIFVGFDQVDHAGHAHGFHPSVEPYIEAIERVDEHVGALVEAAQARKTFESEDWIIIVTTDHGGRGTGHSAGHDVPEILNAFLIVSGDAAERGRIEEQTYLVDAPVTALVHLGVALDAEWKLDGQPRGLKPN